MIFTDANDQEILLIGSNDALEIHPERMNVVGGNANLNLKLAGAHNQNVSGVLSNYAISREQAVKFSDPYPINTDLNAFAEVHQTKIFYSGANPFSDLQKFIVNNFDTDFEKLADLAQYQSKILSFDLLQQTITKLQLQKFGIAFDKKLATINHENLFDLRRSQKLAFDAHQYVNAENLQKEILKEQDTLENHLQYLAILAELKKFEEIDKYNKSQWRHKKSVQCYLAYAAVEKKDAQESKKWIDKLFKNEEETINTCGYFWYRVAGRYFTRQGDYLKAKGYLENYYHHYQSDIDIVGDLVATYLALNEEQNFSTFSTYYSSLKQSRP